MDKTKRALDLQRTAFKKICSKIDDDLSTKRYDLIDIQSKIKVLEEKMLQITELNQLMFDLMLDSDDYQDDMNLEVELMDSLSSQYHNLRFRCENLVYEKESSKKSDSKGKLKIPKLEFRQYGGDLKGWLSFWNQFSRIDEDSDLEEEDKLQYLIQATTPSSRARQIVESYPATKGNYEKAIDSLKQRFGREDLLIEVYVRELLQLVLTNLHSKNKLSTFFDKIETQLRALESLGVKSDTCAAMLYPLVESCLGEDLIRAWHRSQLYSNESSLKKRLDALMDFLRQEVLNEVRISLAVSSFKDKKKQEDRSTSNSISNVATASELFNKVTPRCIFCKGSHLSYQCKDALKLSFEERKQKLSESACCHLCTRFGHIARRCRSREKCDVCQGKHCTLMCYKQDSKAMSTTEAKQDVQSTIRKPEQNLTNHTYTEVFLQTMVVELKGEEQSKRVRLLIDTGSHKSYITDRVAKEIGYIPLREEELVHSLFGGTQTETVNHRCYKIRMYSLTEDYSCNFEVLDQPLICSPISSVRKESWLDDELKRLDIEITDTADGPIDVLVGADVAGKLLSGRKHDLECGLVAVHTLLGWTVMGKVENVKHHTSSMLITSMFSKDIAVSNLWSLDVLGIEDPKRMKTSRDQEQAVMEHFLTTVKQTANKRYEVSMPWLEGHHPLSCNFDLSYKRLSNTTKRLKKDNFYDVYDKVFDNWLAEGIIECSPDDESIEISSQNGHFLPHHPVYKPNSSTTPVRPVFDASSKQKNQPSLNQCLEKGVNLIELIPSMLIRFRTEKIGVIADIKQAFLQIGLNENDRNFLKFLWYDKDQNLKIFRHARVVFGVSCSPFLLGAVLEYHLKKTLRHSIRGENDYSSEVISKLLKSFYVDNVSASVKDEEALYQFIEQSKTILADCKFELRGWEHSLPGNIEVEVKSNVLGLIWNRRLDTFELSLEWFDKMSMNNVTKRSILSAAHKLFDPIGFSCPVSLFPKLLLQKTWSMNLRWDDEIDGEIRDDFLKWLQELPYLKAIKIPRWISSSNSTVSVTQSVHVFCDASAIAYATCIFLRTENSGEVSVRLVEAKSRVAPVKKLTIPRLELLAATIGVRIFKNFKENYESQIQVYYWSDSSTVLSWIKREDQWKPFIWNRVEEIRRFSKPQDWYHIPGDLNPADLPSRGGSPKMLADGRWWEGPKWLYNPISQWPNQNLEYDEDEINTEKRKIVVSSLSVTKEYTWYYRYFSKFSRIVRLIGWIKRFIKIIMKRNNVNHELLTTKELEDAKKSVIRLIQRESFESEEDPKLLSLCPFYDEEGLMRLRTKVSDRNDVVDFCMPYVLPSNHEVVRRLIHEEHVKNSHVGVQSLMRILRENYWILKCRRTVKSVVSKCTTCKKFRGKVLDTPAISLPEARVRDAAVFEVVGIDLAGPLYLKTNEKVWIVLYTCAVYRAVHLELSSSLSSNAFLQTLRRFIARRGRPSVIYTDCGTNFTGSDNALRNLNWTEVTKNCSTIHQIDWRFNPPTAAWWGGWWERLIRLMKDILRKILGRTCLNFEELQTALCDCEAVLNARPLTYMSEDPNDCIVLTPAMFLQDIKEVGVADIDLVEAKNLTKHYRYRLKLKQDLNKRFKSEYLGQLTLFAKKKYNGSVKVGDIVLITDFDKKKLEWPMGRVLETIPGRDREIRLVRLKTASGELLRPVQRLVMLEMEGSHDLSEEAVKKGRRDCSQDSAEIADPAVYTRYGRRVKVPSRYQN